MSVLFDIVTAENFFKSIQRRYRTYQEGHVKQTEDLLCIILGLNHLREWIAPGYEKDKKGNWPPDDTKEKTLSKKVFENSDFDVLRQLANGIKHAKTVKTGFAGGASMDDWPDFDSVADVDKGPPTAHFVDGRPIEEIIEPLFRLYNDWFAGRHQ